MRLVLSPESSAADIRQALDAGISADYVYMYPPRQAYRAIADNVPLANLVSQSLSRSGELNLYVHVPFCRQICAFCNLFTTVSESRAAFESYVAVLTEEIAHYAPCLAGKKVNTVYIGGGTPSLLDPPLLSRVLREIETAASCDLESVAEVAIEVSPETVTREKFAAYREIGVNRVNLGVQSFETAELHTIGRQYGSKTPFAALEIVQELGFKNVCVDLIYGLQGQTWESWCASVEAVLSRAPETICAYWLTLRPVTGFAARGYTDLAAHEQYRRYDYICDRLADAGYRQETHVRWVRNARGGYLQKENHWALQNVLGFGAGARSYLWHCDMRNGYSVRNRRRALDAYMSNVAAHGHGRTDGYLMDDDERMRKAIVLGLINLDRNWFESLFGVDVVDIHEFRMQFDKLVELGLMTVDPRYLRLTPRGLRHRDVLVQLFFSSRVRSLLASFSYDE